MNTGHDGSMGTIHSNSPGEALSRLENLFLLAGYDIPLRALRYQIISAIHFIIQIGRDKDGHRVIKKIVEVTGLEEDRITMHEIGREEEGGLAFTGLVPSKMSALVGAGLAPDFFNK